MMFRIFTPPTLVCCSEQLVDLEPYHAIELDITLLTVIEINTLSKHLAMCDKETNGN